MKHNTPRGGHLTIDHDEPQRTDFSRDRSFGSAVSPLSFMLICSLLGVLLFGVCGFIELTYQHGIGFAIDRICELANQLPRMISYK